MILLCTGIFSAPALSALPDLSRGVNTETTWLWFAPSERWSEAWPADQLAELKATGVSHIRLNVAPEPFMGPQGEPLEQAEVIGDATRRARAAGLDVVVDLHPDNALVRRYQLSATTRAHYLRFAVGIARMIAPIDSGHVALEPFNEPRRSVASAPWDWPGWLAQMHRSLRAAAPQLPLVLSGDDWGSLTGLLALRNPPRDALTIYTFHDYEPFLFTHQGADWTGDRIVAALRAVPYPSSPARVRRAIALADAALPTPALRQRARRDLARYGAERVGAATVSRDLGQAASWGRRQGVRLYLGEFGVYSRYADEGSARRFYADVRRGAERHRIGWASWFYWEHGGVTSALNTTLGLQAVRPGTTAR